MDRPNDHISMLTDGLENYDILSELVTHNSFQTFRARCKRGRMKNRVVALKKIPKTPNNPSESVVLQLSLHHPSINSLFSIFSNQTHLFYVLELCSGGSLADFVQSRIDNGACKTTPCLSDGMIRTVIKPLLDALVYLKKEGIVHRDINPYSVLLTAEGRVKLSNFEKATTDTEQDFTAFTSIYKMTEESDTEYVYVAPEILSRRDYDCTADLWSLGCVAFACVTGKSPFQVEAIDQMFENILRAKYSMPHCISGLLENFVDGLLRTEPSHRTDLFTLLQHPFLNPRLPEEPLILDKTSQPLMAEQDEQTFPQPKPLTIGASRRIPKPRQLSFRAPSSFKENVVPPVNIGSTGNLKSTNDSTHKISDSESRSSVTRGPLREIKNADLRRILSDEISYKRTIMGMEASTGDMQSSTQDGKVLERQVISDTPGQGLNETTRISLLHCPRVQSAPTQTRVPSSSSQGTSTTVTRVHRDPDEGHRFRSSTGDKYDSAQVLNFATSDQTNLPDLRDDLPVGTLRPSPLNTDLLNPRVHKTVQGQVTVLPSGSLLVDFREAERRRGLKGQEVLVISKCGTDIKIYLAPHLSVPCCLVEPVGSYAIDALPKVYWKQYNDASTLISRIKQRTPRMVLHEQTLKYTLMANSPQADIELLFFDPPSSNMKTSTISRSSPPAASKNSKQDMNDLPDTETSKHTCKMRFRYSRQTHLLEVAERINGSRGKEWMKKNVHVTQPDALSSTANIMKTLYSEEERGAIDRLLWFLRLCNIVEEESEHKRIRGAQDETPSQFVLHFGQTKDSFNSVQPSFSVKDPGQSLSTAMKSLSTVDLPPRPLKLARSRTLRKSGKSDPSSDEGDTMKYRDNYDSMSPAPTEGTWTPQDQASGRSSLNPSAQSGLTIGSSMSNDEAIQALQTRFIPGVGWCVRHASKISQGGRYKLMFLDGKVLNVDVDEERSIRGSHSQPVLSERMKVFEEFVSMFEWYSFKILEFCLHLYVTVLEETPLNCAVGVAVQSNGYFTGPSCASPTVTPVQACPAVKTARNRHRYVSTFNPARLTRSDYVDISHLKRLAIQLQDCTASVDYVSVREGATKRLPFPPGSAGFFYYHTSPYSPLDGGIRFRLTSMSAKTAPFNLWQDGQDLLFPNGLPWSIPLHTMISQKQHAGLVFRLFRTQLVSRSTLITCRKVFSRHSHIRWNANVVYSLNQIIAVRRDQKSCKLLVVLDDRTETVTLTALKILGGYQREGDDSGYAHACIRYDFNTDQFFSQVTRVQRRFGGIPLIVKADPVPLRTRSGGKVTPLWHFLKKVPDIA
ncbi:hypothetical protein K435DRAFT_961334 [Dendrothele bispora CBS 962.96]|uniref:Uncharacterized protein n=1 Tax=Dendrothele bispora (strain CBS 962.96) TaxID=1314807 RepID=A0A4V4HI49_DENBC|nr:hypothetical protein K435DRAFT_961334 [Dendrothele bispora CBS 962.96]